jgi:hypothetical protein
MNTTTRAALLGGLVTASLVAAIPALTTWTEPPPTTRSPAHRSPAEDDTEADSDQIRLAWLVRPRPTLLRSPTI